MMKPVLKRVVAGLLPVLLCVGCSGERSMRCVSDDLYRSAVSVPPIRVPDDLSIPDESEALQLPRPSASARAEMPEGACLESPPDYFGG